MILRPLRPPVLGALGYFVIGVASALITNPVQEPRLQAALRLVALLLGGLVFAAHARHEIVRLGHSVRAAATRVSAGAALGSFMLAVCMVLYNVIARSRDVASVAAVLVVWPLVAGLLGFAAALVLGRVVVWWQRSHAGA